MDDVTLTTYHAALAAIDNESRALSAKIEALALERQHLQQVIRARRSMLGLPAEQDQAVEKTRRRIKDFGAKSIFVRELLRQKPEGLSGAEIREAAALMFEFPGNFPYSLLGGWIEKGWAAKTAEGKYVLTDSANGRSA